MSALSDAYERNFLKVEAGLAFLAGAAFYGVMEFVYKEGPLLAILDGNRQALYGALSAVTGSLLGFVLAAATIVLVYAQLPRFRVLRDTGTIRIAFRVYIQSSIWLGIATILEFVGLVADTEKAHSLVINYVLFGVLILCAVRFGRCIWILGEMTRQAFMQVSDGEEQSRMMGAPPPESQVTLRN
jgi:hypothetical protein